MVEANDITTYVAAFVALWWAIDWLNMRQEGEPLPLRRAPLRMLGDVLPKLWRNRTFIAVLVALWLIGASVASVQGFFLRMSSQAPGLQDEQMPMERPFTIAEGVPEILRDELPGALPRPVGVPLGAWGALLLAVLLIVAIVRVALDPPESIGGEGARRLWWPAGVLLAALAMHLVMIAIGNKAMGGRGIDPPSSSAGSALMLIAGIGLLPALLAPLFALLWRLVLEIVRDGVWSFASAIRALAESWLPISLVLLIANGFRVIAIEAQPGVRGIGYVYLAVLVLLALVPFAIVDRHEGVGAAFARTWRLFRQKPVDVIAFGLRFTLLFAMLGGLVALAEPHPAMEWGAWYAPLLGVLRHALVLLQVAVLAGLYVHLSELLEEDDACAGCPATRMAERLEQQTEEEQ